MLWDVIKTSKRKTIRGPINPLDKCTVVSIYPREIDENKPTISPGRFIIKPGTFDNPSILVVGPSSWWREVDLEQPLIEIPNSSIQVAESIVKDYCNGLFACNMDNAMPGLFFIPGEHTVMNIQKDYKGALIKARDNQNRWYEELIRLADAFWSRTNGNPLCISDDMRLAAREMARFNKDWMTDHQAFEMVRCVACGALRNPKFPICGSCHLVVDKELAKSLGIETTPVTTQSVK